jgi:hypothetical protein
VRQIQSEQGGEVPKEDKLILLFVAATLAYFGAHVVWALMKPWVTVAINAMPK